MQDGMLYIPRNSPPVYFVRRSYERAVKESAFPDIRQMKSFRDAACETAGSSGSVVPGNGTGPACIVFAVQEIFPVPGCKAPGHAGREGEGGEKQV